MARTTTEIQAALDAAYKSEFGLTDEQVSNAGRWKLIRGIVSLSIFSLEKLFDLFKAEVNNLNAASEVGGFRWWKNKLLDFQYGDPLIEENGRLFYLQIDDSKKIIKKCSVIEDESLLKLKIAGTEAGELVKITDTAERAAIESYIKDIKPAGVQTMILSSDADLLAFDVVFVFDGKLVQADFENETETAINFYLNNIDFDGEFRINKFRDSLEFVPGMIDVFINQVKWKPEGVVNYQNLSLSLNHSPVSGYYKHDIENSNLTFIAK